MRSQHWGHSTMWAPVWSESETLKSVRGAMYSSPAPSDLIRMNMGRWSKVHGNLWYAMSKWLTTLAMCYVWCVISKVISFFDQIIAFNYLVSITIYILYTLLLFLLYILSFLSFLCYWLWITLTSFLLQSLLLEQELKLRKYSWIKIYNWDNNINISHWKIRFYKQFRLQNSEIRWNYHFHKNIRVTHWMWKFWLLINYLYKTLLLWNIIHTYI